MSVMQRTAKVRFDGRRSEGGGRAKWTLISSSDSEASILKLELPDGSPLKPEEITGIDQISVERGFKNPATVAKTVGVTAGSLIVGNYLFNEILGTEYFAEIGTSLRSALEHADNEELMQLADEFLVREIVAIIVGAGALVAPAAYGAIALSRREIRLRLMMQSGATHTVKCPEYVGGFLLGAYKAVTGVVDEDPVSSDSASEETEANTDALPPESEAPAPA